MGKALLLQHTCAEHVAQPSRLGGKRLATPTTPAVAVASVVQLRGSLIIVLWGYPLLLPIRV